MAKFHKIWIEVDVLKEPDDKTEKVLKIINALQEVQCVKNVTKTQYIMSSEEDVD